MINHPLDDITEAHLLELVAQGAEEGKTLDFKREIGEDTTKLAADFCAMANSFGGDIVFGIDEEQVKGQQTGRAAKIVPLNLDHKDAKMLLVEATFRDKIQPRLPVSGRQLRAVPVAGGYVLIVRLSQSLNAPHRVRPKNGAGDFYARNSRGNEQMDLDEVRNAFLFADSLADRATAFRDRRLDALLANQGPVSMPPPTLPLFIAHVVPLQALTRRQTYPVGDLLTLSPRLRLACPSGHPLNEAQPNYEGVICQASPNGAGEILGYAQLFRDGCMEIVGSPFDVEAGSPKQKIFALPLKAESFFIGHDYAAIFQTMDALRVVPPALVFISWLHTGNLAVRLPSDDNSGWIEKRLPERLSRLVGPPAYLDSFDPTFEINGTARRIELIRPAFDVMWNALGRRGSQTRFSAAHPNY
ncbi:MAG: ATP-binding protein [Pseudomonadota bacterium]